MAEYIEREELLKDIEEERPENWTDSESERQAENDFYKYRDIVKMQIAADECKELNTTIDDLRVELKYLRKATANRCGTCIYAKPVVWGRSKMQVECTNAEHLKKHCSNHESSKIRPKNTHACKNYVERVGES